MNSASIQSLFSTKNSLFFCSLISLGTLIFFNGTGKEADSISHYLYSRYAFEHPELFFNHWAKPLYTLIFAPIAQLGFGAVKFFNALISIGTAYFIIQIAKKHNLQNAGLAACFYFLFPLSYLTTFSGLTEPLFAFFLTASIYLCFKKKLAFAALILSFTPFIRSEGLIFLGIFGLYFFIHKNYKAIALLFTAHFLYAIVGYFYYADLLWVFREIPYTALDSPYGEGNFFHYFHQLNSALGIPLYILFWFGFLFLLIDSHQKKSYKSPAFLLICLGFASFFVAHTIFWTYGIFNSMGLRRVFAAVTPLMAFIALLGFNRITYLLPIRFRKMVQILILLMVFIFPFSGHKSAIEQEKLNLSQAQKLAVEVSIFLEKENLKNRQMVYTDPYLGETLGIDPFDPKKRLILSREAFEEWKNGAIVIWDKWHAVVDYQVNLIDLEERTDLKKIHFLERGKSHYVIFEVQKANSTKH